MPGEQATAGAATGRRRHSRAQSPNSARATKRSAISCGDAVLSCRHDRATCSSWRKSRSAAKPFRSRFRRNPLGGLTPQPERRGAPPSRAVSSTLTKAKLGLSLCNALSSVQDRQIRLKQGFHCKESCCYRGAVRQGKLCRERRLQPKLYLDGRPRTTMRSLHERLPALPGKSVWKACTM